MKKHKWKRNEELKKIDGRYPIYECVNCGLQKASSMVCHMRMYETVYFRMNRIGVVTEGVFKRVPYGCDPIRRKGSMDYLMEDDLFEI